MLPLSAQGGHEPWCSLPDLQPAWVWLSRWRWRRKPSVEDERVPVILSLLSTQQPVCSSGTDPPAPCSLSRAQLPVLAQIPLTGLSSEGALLSARHSGGTQALAAVAIFAPSGLQRPHLDPGILSLYNMVVEWGALEPHLGSVMGLWTQSSQLWFPYLYVASTTLNLVKIKFESTHHA